MKSIVAVLTVFLVLGTSTANYCDSSTQPSERTLVLIKPDGVQRGLVGRVLQRFEDRQLKIVGLNQIHASRQQLEEHYEEHKDRTFFVPLLDYMQSGPTVVLVLEGNNVVAIVRKMIGVTNSADAAPGTIRGDFCTEKQMNLVHASENVIAASREIHLWMPDLVLSACMASGIASFGTEGNHHVYKLTDYVWDQIVASYTHLLFSVNFDIYTRDRPGFQKLYRGLSDKAWDKAIGLTKYYTARGGRPNFDLSTNLTSVETLGKYDTNVIELKSLEEAVTLEKKLSHRAYEIHSHFSSHKPKEARDLDAGIAHYMEEEFIEYQAETVRKLVGYHNDLKSILNGENCQRDKNGALACFLFDEYLQKQ